MPKAKDNRPMQTPIRHLIKKSQQLAPPKKMSAIGAQPFFSFQIQQIKILKFLILFSAFILFLHSQLMDLSDHRSEAFGAN